MQARNAERRALSCCYIALSFPTLVYGVVLQECEEFHIEWTTIDAVFQRNQSVLNRSILSILAAARNQGGNTKDGGTMD